MRAFPKIDLGSTNSTPQKIKENINTTTQNFNNKKNKCKKITIKTNEEYKNERIQYAYDISNCNLDFVLTIHAENGAWDEKRLSNLYYYRNGKKYYDIGICQFSQYYYRHIVQDNRFSDWRWQIEQCWNIYQKRKTAFYGYYNRKKFKNLFIIE